MNDMARGSGREAFLGNSARIPGEVLDLFLQDFRRFDAAGQGLDFPQEESGAFAVRLLRYVIDGEGAALAGVRTRPGWSVASTDNDREARSVRWRIYDRWDDLPPRVLIRFAQALAAGSPVLQGCPRLDLSRTAPWVEVLARDLTGVPISHEMFWRRKGFEPHPLATIGRLAALMAEEGMGVDALLRSAFASGGGLPHDGCDFLGALGGFGAELARGKADLAPFFREGPSALRMRALSLLAAAGSSAWAAFAGELIGAAADSDAELREAALAMVETLAAPVRARALKAIEAVRRADAAEARRPSLRARIPEIDVNARTSVEARQALSAWLAAVHDAFRAAPGGWGEGAGTAEPPSSNLLMRLAHEIECAPASALPAGDAGLNRFKAFLWARERALRWRDVTAWMAGPGVQPVHVARLLAFTGQVRRTAAGAWTMSDAAHRVIRAAVMTCRRGSLLEFARAFEALGAPETLFVRLWYEARGVRLTAGWAKDLVWPFFASIPQALDPGFDSGSVGAGEPGFDRMRLFAALAAFPELPDAVVPRLAALAFTPDPRLRLAARRLLEEGGQAGAAAAQRLGEADAGRRAEAALWLARIRDGAARAPLAAAFRKERDEEAQAAMLAALEALGEPAERYLPRDDLAAAAAAALNRATPPALAWFPFDRLPPVRWDSDGEPVTAEALRWLVIEAHRAGSPQPGPILRRRCRMFRAGEAEALGAFTLRAWLEEDPAPGDPALEARGVLALAAGCGGAHVAEMARLRLEGLRLEAGGARRAGQGRALIAMLAATDHPAAERLALSAGDRFGDPDLREESGRQARRLAARAGWSSEDLADRTIPWAGFDETGTLTLTLGGRRVTARLTERLDIELMTEAGAILRTAPGAGPGDGAGAEAERARAMLRHAAQVLLRRQEKRLAEALRARRIWRFADWSLYLGEHPLLRFLCQRLVWGVLEDGRAGPLFRLLSDGALTDAHGGLVTPDPDAAVLLVQEGDCDAAAAQAWLEHFRLYGLEPLLPQFGTPHFGNPPARDF